jgi:hypothetical protein
MVRFIYTLSAFFIAQLAIGQTVSINPKVSTKAGANSSDISPSSTIINNSADNLDTVFTWSILSATKPTGWQIDFCDPSNCIVDVKQGSNYDFVLSHGAAGLMKADFYFFGTSGQGSIKAVVTSKKNPTNSDTVTFNATAWVTSVNETAKAKVLSFYPNPVKDEITIKYPAKNPIEVSIYNILGSKVKSFVHSGKESSIHIESLQNGVYFIRFEDEGKLFTKQFVKTN